MSLNLDDLKGDDISLSISMDHSLSRGVDDAEFAKLQNQLNDYEKFLTMLNVQIEERRQRYSGELSKIKDSIQEQQKKLDFVLEEQLQIQKQEEEQLKNQLEKQYIEITSTANEKDEQVQKWRESHNMIIQLEKEIEISNLKSDYLRSQGTMMSNTLEIISRQSNRNSEIKSKKRALQNMIETLEYDVEKYKQDVAFQKDKYSNIINEIQLSLKRQEQFFELSKKKIADEVQKRDKFFSKHINTVKKAIEREKRQIEVETSLHERKYQSLVDIRKENNKRCTQLITRFNTDIQRMQTSLAAANKNIDYENESTMSSLSKSDSIYRHTDELRSTEATLAAELDRLYTVNDRAAAALKSIMDDERHSFSSIDFDMVGSPFKIPRKYNV